MCYLPADWKFPSSLGGAQVTDESWPIDMIRSLSKYVQATGSWLAENHGLPNFSGEETGMPFTPSTKLSHMILLSPIMEDDDFNVVNVDGTFVNLYLVVPLTAAEAAWKREVGAVNSIYYIVGSKALGGEHVLVDYIIDPKRPCCVTDLNCREIYDNLPHEQDEEEESEDEESDDEDDMESGNEDDNDENSSNEEDPSEQIHTE